MVDLGLEVVEEAEVVRLLLKALVGLEEPAEDHFARATMAALAAAVEEERRC